MTHTTVSLANNGVVHQPHSVKEVLGLGTRKIAHINPNPGHQIPFRVDSFGYVKCAMEEVLKPGGVTHRIDGGLAYTMGGRTGTTQAVRIKQGGRCNVTTLHEQHRDHAWLISFAPLEKPKIVIVVTLEDGD